MEPTRECSLGSTTSVRLTPSAPGGHGSASTVPISKTRMAHAAIVLRIIPLNLVWAGLARCAYATQPASGSFRGVSRLFKRGGAASRPLSFSEAGFLTSTVAFLSRLAAPETHAIEDCDFASTANLCEQTKLQGSRPRL